MSGFYGVYYSGANGSAALGLLLRDGQIYGVDPAGGDLGGSYVERTDGGLDLALVFYWPAGAVLVTGRTLPRAITVPADVTINAATLAGGHQAVDLPIGRVNVRVVRKVAA